MGVPESSRQAPNSTGSGWQDAAIAGELMQMRTGNPAANESFRTRSTEALDLMIQAVTGLESQLASTRLQMASILEAVHHGVMLVDKSDMVTVCNSSAARLFGLPGELSGKQFPVHSILPSLAGLLAASGGWEVSETITRPNGRLIEIIAQKFSFGGTIVHTSDVTERRSRERRLQLAEAEYRSLFENSVYGIYRDSLDGKPVRANPALAAFNGYINEEEHIAAVYASPSDWYVNPRHADEFFRILRANGRVKDLVSEVYRHKTREKCWITENAWYVYDTVGNPMYIEGTIQDATERIQATAEIERLANCDPMTGAANRFSFLRTLREWTADPENPCVLFCVDLDRFKEVNDTLGHAAGDFVLKTAIERLQRIAGEEGVVARLGGDEFALLMELEEGTGAVELTAATIVARLAEPMVSEMFNLEVGSSIGVAIFPMHASGSDELLNSADLALYHVKATGRNGFHIFDFHLKESINMRKSIERDLRQALRNRELELYYQPIVEAEGQSIVRFEALMRWNHPGRGQVSPAVFIPIAEEAGLMPELGAWAIATACEQARGFPANLTVSVNVSAIQLRSPNLISHVEQALDASGLEPSRLELEVTETAILASQTTAEQVLNRLRHMGVKIALDDFGTGYSSLSYLQRFAFNTVKIDRSFVAGMKGQPANLAIIRAVLSIGRDLGIEVVAEGVETEDQFHALRAQGCSLIQGYFFGKPQAYTEIVSHLAALQLPVNNRSAGRIESELRKTA